MTPEQYLQALRRDGEALALAADQNLARPVPSCPDWTMAELVRHIGQVHRHKLATVEAGGTERPDIAKPDTPQDDGQLLGWYHDGLDRLVERLAHADPQAPAWSWAGDHRVAFWQRRMAQETLVHRWDAENAAGSAGPMDAELAADGIDEYLRVFLTDPDFPAADPTGTVAIVAADLDRRWSVDTRQWPPTIGDGEDQDATARGTAEQLLLVLWRRRLPGTVSVTGAAAVFQSMLDAADL